MPSVLGAPYAKHVPPAGHALIVGNVILTSSSLSGTLITVPTGVWCDIYSIFISSSDSTSETVSIADGVTSLEYIVTAPSPIVDEVVLPYRFKQGAILTATAAAITSGKSISVVIRGTAPWT